MSAACQEARHADAGSRWVRFRPVTDAESTAAEVRDLRRDEHPAAVGVLARGMRDNPLHVAALGPDPEGAVVILNGDVLSGHDLGAQLADFETARDERTVDVSLHLVEVEDAQPQPVGAAVRGGGSRHDDLPYVGAFAGA